MVARPWQVYGPFELDKKSALTWKQLFHNHVGNQPGLVNATGVYVIAVSNRSSDRIRYIGMTYKQGFETEIFSQRNIQDVWNAIELQKCRAIIIWLFAKPNAFHSGFSKDKRIYRQAHLLEDLLIMHARAAGHKLINTKKMKSAEGISVRGLFGTNSRGAKPKAATTIAAALKI